MARSVKERPAAGTKVRLSRVGWRERQGLVATVVDTAGAEHVYPVHGLQRSEVIVHLEKDPIGSTPIHTLANGEPWSCVVHLAAVDLVDSRPHDLAGCRRRHGTEGPAAGMSCLPDCGCRCHLAAVDLEEDP